MSIPLEHFRFKSSKSKDMPYLTNLSCHVTFQGNSTADTQMYDSNPEFREHMRMNLQESVLHAVYGDIKRELHELHHLAMSGSNYSDRHRIHQLYHSMISNMGVLE